METSGLNAVLSPFNTRRERREQICSVCVVDQTRVISEPAMVFIHLKDESDENKNGDINSEFVVDSFIHSFISPHMFFLLNPSISF